METDLLNRQWLLNQLDDLGTLCNDQMISVTKLSGGYGMRDIYGEPIYIGKTAGPLIERITRHLIFRSTDAIRRGCYDPDEVYELEIWPLQETNTNKLSSLEYSIYQEMITNSLSKSSLNERPIAAATITKLPQSYQVCLVSPGLLTAFMNPDTRIKQRHATLQKLSQTMRECGESPDLRRLHNEQITRIALISSGQYQHFTPGGKKNVNRK